MPPKQKLSNRMREFMRTGIKKPRGGVKVQERKKKRMMEMMERQYGGDDGKRKIALVTRQDGGDTEADHEMTRASNAHPTIPTTTSDDSHLMVPYSKWTISISGHGQQLPIHIRKQLEKGYKQTRDPSILVHQHNHITKIAALDIPPTRKHWNIIPNDIKMPCAYHPDKTIAGECMKYCMFEANKYMRENNNCGWTTEAFTVARLASVEFKSKMVPMLFPAWKDCAQNY